MIDLSGTEVASYVYDSWGNIKDTKGEPTIREINPIRYRSYVYDEQACTISSPATMTRSQADS